MQLHKYVATVEPKTLITKLTSISQNHVNKALVSPGSVFVGMSLITLVKPSLNKWEL